MYQFAKIFLSLFFLLILSCNDSTKNLENKLIWHSIEIPSLDSKWLLEKQNTKSITFKCINCDDNPTIYLEYMKMPENSSLTIDSFLERFLQDYKDIYDGISTKKIVADDLQGYEITHYITADNRKLNTVILPKGSDFIAIVFIASIDKFEIFQNDFDLFLSKIKIK